ncbi:uncharacterized protein LOC111901670 [Lactuca sativa]|uniref:uncharacterized protein LOC111901670 n=1 Tax=Lactuca sativa TaxID=4236 RepID=UPI000CD8061A|nr:uncharacterized protein LOC111901670 [Lactuca sativa]
MLAIIPPESPYLKQHLETLVVFDPTQPSPVSVEPTSEEANPDLSGPKPKKSGKRKSSTSKLKAKKKTKVGASSQQEGTHDIPADSGHPHTPLSTHPRAASRHPDLNRTQVECTLISMRNRAIQSNLPYTPTNAEANDALTSTQPPITAHQSAFHIDPEEEIFEEVMLEDDATKILDAHLMTSIHYQSKASVSKAAFDFGTSSTSTLDDGSNCHHQEDNDAIKPGPFPTSDTHQPPPQQSDSDSESSIGDHVDPFALLEIRTNVSDTMAKVSSVETSVTELNLKLDQKVSGIDSKLDTILQSLSRQSGPSSAEREAHLD